MARMDLVATREPGFGREGFTGTVQSPMADVRSAAPVLAGARVLIIDDEEGSIALLERLLHTHGYKDVCGYTDSAEALAKFRDLAPDLVIVDAHMPGLDGFAVLKALGRIREPGTYVPVLMLTGDESVETRRRALNLGANDYLIKPFDVVEAIYRIHNLLHTRLLHRQLQEEREELAARVRERTRALEQAHAQTLARLAQAAELRDDDTGEHTHRVARAAAAIARHLGLPPEQVELIREAAPLHDLGKIGIPDAILLKPGPLTAEEWVQMRTHTTMGARILAGGGSRLMEAAEEIALCHHECWDGSGYPRSLAGEQIPLPARIVAVADFYDALTHDRPYREAWPVARVLDAAQKEAGTRFDPDVTAALAAAWEAGDLGHPSHT